jgi:hypothetical protein
MISPPLPPVSMVGYTILGLMRPFLFSLKRHIDRQIWSERRQIYTTTPKLPTLMSSTSHIDLTSISVEELSNSLSKVECALQTEALRARLPAQLVPFASNISVTTPVQSISISPTDGLNESACEVNESRVVMSVTVFSSDSQPKDDSDEPGVKSLELVWRHWWTASGSVYSRMYSLFLEYGRPSDIKWAKRAVKQGRRQDRIIPAHEMPLRAKAFTGLYGDPGMDRYRSTHGGIKMIVAELVKDMGFSSGGEVNKLDVLESLLGDGARESLDRCVEEERPTFRKVIEEELEESTDPY